MTTNSSKYTNPRIDGRGASADASRGKVSPDPVKILWVGSMMLFGTIGSALTVSLDAVLLFVFFTAITLCFGHSLGMHRRFIHRSYQCPKWMEYLFVHLGTLVGLAGPLGMLKTHDTRDWAQRQSACHAFFAHDEVWYRDFCWQIFCSIKLANPPELVIESDIEKDRVYLWMERTWMLQQLPWAILFYSLGGWAWVFWGICSRVSVSVIGHWLIGYFAHNSGSQHWQVVGAAVQGYNVSWCALLTMGESWHNNHHAFPGSAKLGLAKGEWDPGWWALKGLERIGLVSNLITDKTLNARANLRTVPEQPSAYLT